MKNIYVTIIHDRGQKSKPLNKIFLERKCRVDKTKFPSIREAAKRGPLSEYCLRLMQKQGMLPGVYSGKKFLVNYDKLIERLNTEGGNAE